MAISENYRAGCFPPSSRKAGFQELLQDLTKAMQGKKKELSINRPLSAKKIIPAIKFLERVNKQNWYPYFTGPARVEVVIRLSNEAGDRALRAGHRPPVRTGGGECPEGASSCVSG